MSRIFAENAPALRSVGLSVIPLWSNQKKPALLDWSRFCNVVADDDEFAGWMAQHGDGNIGLACGPASGLVAFDVDTTNGELIKIIEDLMPAKSAWRRVGAKGWVGLFRYSGEKTFQIRDQEGGTICELLSAGRQVVLPPSIHPDTKMPYTANMDLAGFLREGGQFPALPRDFERILRGALAEIGHVKLAVQGYSKLTDLVPKSTRDTQATHTAGLYARDIIYGRMPLLQAIQELSAWVAGFVEKVDGDDLTADEVVNKLLRFVRKEVVEKGNALPIGWDKGLTEEDKAKLDLDFAGGHEELPFEEIVSLFRSDIEEAAAVGSAGGPGSDREETRLNMVAVDTVLKRVKQSKNITDVQVDYVLRAVVTFSKVKMSLASLRKQLRGLNKNGLTGEDQSAIAQHMLDETSQFEKIKWSDGQFWRWSGSCWEMKEQWELEHAVIREYAGLPVCKRDADYKSIVKTFRTLVTGPLREKEVIGVNFSNGFLTRDLELIDPQPEFGCTYVMPYPYRGPAAVARGSAGIVGEGTLVPGAPLFSKFLTDSWGEDADFDAKVAALRDAICATLFGLSTKMARAILLYGVAHSGKSVLLQIVTGLMPRDKVSAVAPNNWGDKFSPAQLAGKMLNIGGELHEKHKIDGQVFKQIVVGEPISAQHKNQPIFTFEPRCAQWFASNYLPISDDMSAGFFRRWLILTFGKEYPERLRNVNLAEDIVAGEREAIVTWAVDVIGDLERRGGYELPVSHEARIKEVLTGQDTIYFFIQESPRIQMIPLIGEVGPDGEQNLRTTGKDELFYEYQNFTVASGARPVGRATFSMRMRSLGPMLGVREIIKTNANGSLDVGYAGLMLKGASGVARR